MLDINAGATFEVLSLTGLTHIAHSGICIEHHPQADTRVCADAHLQKELLLCC
jgi:hypothetical protein